MGPVVGGLVSGGASLLGGVVNSIFGSKSNRETNRTNMKIAQMNNETSNKPQLPDQTY